MSLDRTKSFNDKRPRDILLFGCSVDSVATPPPVRTSGKIIRVSSGLFDYICIWQSCESNYSAQTSPSKRFASAQNFSSIQLALVSAVRPSSPSSPPPSFLAIQKLEIVYPPILFAWHSWRWSCRPVSAAFRCWRPHRSPSPARTCRWAGCTWTLTEFRELIGENTNINK